MGSVRIIVITHFFPRKNIPSTASLNASVTHLPNYGLKRLNLRRRGRVTLPTKKALKSLLPMIVDKDKKVKDKGLRTNEYNVENIAAKNRSIIVLGYLKGILFVQSRLM